MTEDSSTQLLAVAADQLRDQNDSVAGAFVEHSARVGNPAVRKTIARQVSNLYGGIGSRRGSVVRRAGVVDTEAARTLDKTLKELYEVVTSELVRPVGED
jgi:hypothetical protein